jgi:major membrane immunogen (membrane-anchored lipoprotein)
MKSRFLAKAYIVTLLMLAVIFFLVSCSKSEGANWKEYFQDSDGTYYYDKDSIHYPQQKKTLFGIAVQNKEIVNVWVRKVSKEDGKTDDATIEQIYCLERECAGHRSPAGFSLYPDVYKKVSRHREPIEPGSMYESLLKKVCP